VAGIFDSSLIEGMGLMRIRHYFAMLLLTAVVGCGGKKTDKGDGQPRMPESLPPEPLKLEKYRVKFETSKGGFVVEVTKDFAPRGAARFYKAVEAGFYDGCRFFRVVPGFVVQWGINGDPEVQKKWRTRPILDEPVRMSNTKGTITFAKGGPDSRTTQVFINLKDNSRLDGDGFPAFGRVISGMQVVESINPEYGERPDQGRIQKDGNEYLNESYPRLDYIKKATILKDGMSDAKPAAKKKAAAGKTQKTDKTDKKAPKTKAS
jgi:peptidyl-prolyl cis-trans isomerase A (cyclophilin A)